MHESFPTPATSGVPAPRGNNANSGDCGPRGELTILVAPHTATYGARFAISGRLDCNGSAVPGAIIVVTHPSDTGDVGGSTAVQTGSDGEWSAGDRPARTTEYMATWSGNATCSGGAESDVMRAEVRPGVIVNADNAYLFAGEQVVFAGRVLPMHPGSNVILQVLQGDSGRWTEVGWAVLDEQSRYAIPYRKVAPGYLVFRVAFPTQDDDHAWNTSRRLRITWE